MKKVYKDTVWGISAKITAMLFFLLTDILIVRLMSNKEIYGEWTYYNAIAAVMFVVGRLGINSASQVFVAGENNASRKYAFIIESLFSRIIISSIVAFVLFIVFPNISWFLGYPEKYPELRLLFFILPFWVLLNTIVDYFKCLNVGFVKFDFVFWITIAEYFNNLILGVGGLLLVHSIYGLAVGYIGAYLLTFLMGLLFLRIYMSDNKLFGNWKEHITINKEILKYSIPVFLSNMVSVLLMDMDTIMLGMFSPASEVGIYSIAKSLMTKLTNLNLALATSTMTVFAIITTENVDEKKNQFKRLVLMNFACVSVVCLGCLVGGKIVIKTLYGTAYLDSVPILFELIPYYALFSLSLLPAILLNYQRLAVKSLKYNIVMFLCNLVLNLVLIPSYGANGAAIATSISIIPYTILLYISGHKIFKPKEYVPQ